MFYALALPRKEEFVAQIEYFSSTYVFTKIVIWHNFETTESGTPV